MMRWLILSLCLAMALPATAGSARAQPSPEADARYEDGKTLLTKGRYDEALSAFKEALGLTEEEGQRWQLMLAVALTYEKMEKPVFALEYYRRFLNVSSSHAAAMGPKWKQRRRVAEDTVRLLEAAIFDDHGLVSIQSTPTGARLTVDGAPAGADGAISPFGAYVAPGTHTVRGELMGYEPAEVEVVVVAGKLHPVTLELKPIHTPEPEAPTVIYRTPPGPSASALVGWVLVGTGVAVGAGGAAFTMLALDDQEAARDLPAGPEYDRAVDSLETHRTLSYVFYGVGGVAIATGVALVVADALGSSDDTSESLNVTLLPGGAMATAQGRF